MKLTKQLELTKSVKIILCLLGGMAMALFLGFFGGLIMGWGVVSIAGFWTGTIPGFVLGYVLVRGWVNRK